MYVDPSSSLGLLLRVAGIGTVLLLVPGAVLLSAELAFALLRGRPGLVRHAAAGLGVIAAAWAVGLGLTLVALRGRTLAPPEELAFCGLDCHLHVGVRAVRRATHLDVTLALRSDARREPEFPGLLDYAVTSADGRRFDPVAGGAGGTLAAGESREVTLGFDVPADATGLRLVASWRGTPGWLVPGPDQVLVQRRSGIALAPQALR
jgi:hypothetical protein